jgi:hypothetical protein
LTLTSLTGTGFDNTQQYSWLIATAGSITSLPTVTSVNGTDFAGLTPASFRVVSTGTGLLLNYTPVPEPGSVLVTCAAAAGVVGWRRRRRCLG